MKEKHFKDKVERRVQKDRRRNKFGRRGPKILNRMANWLTSNPNAFYCYMIASMLALFYSLANVAYNLNGLIMLFFKHLIEGQ